MNGLLLKCSQLSLKAGFFETESFWIIDETCREWVFKHVVRKGYAGVMGRFNVFLNPKILVEIQISRGAQVDLKRAKGGIRHSIDKMHGLPKGDRRRILSKVDDARSMPELVRKLIVEDDRYDLIIGRHPEFGEG